MKLLILGGTGPTGEQLVKQALEKSHTVTVLARDPSKVKISHANLTVVKGDVLDAAIVTKTIKDKEAVLSVLGTGKSLKSSNLMTNAVKNIIQGMKAANVTRLILQSAFGVGETYKQASLIQKFVFKTFLRDIYADKIKADALIHHSSLDWTLVFPVLLTKGPLTGDCTAGEVLPMTGMPNISRADVAAFELEQLTDKQFLRKDVIVKS